MKTRLRAFFPQFAFLVLFHLHAQDDVPIGLVRGSLIETKGSERAGQIKVRTPDGLVFTCLYDDKTYMEHTAMRIFASALHVDDPIEVVGDRQKFPGRCYARTIRVVDSPLANPSRIRPYRMVTEHIAPRGNLTFSGVVVRIQDELLILRTRDGDASMLLRPDTRYIDGGSPTERAYLKPNMRVSVRGGKNLEKQTEAYQIYWGEILKP